MNGFCGFNKWLPEFDGESFVAGIGVESGDKKCSETTDKFTEELGEFFARFRLLVNEFERGGAVLFNQMSGQGGDRFP